MTRLPLPGFWYGENCYRPDGSHGYWASPIVGNFTQTEIRQIPTDPLGFTRGTPFGRFAGQSRLGLTGNKEYKESDGSGHIVGPSPVENPVLYLRDGTLVQGQTAQGADGLRYQADDGSIVTSDQTHVSPDGLLANYTELHNIRIGSDQIVGLGAIVQLLTHPGGTGPRYILEPGSCTEIRYTFTEPNKLAVYVVKLQESTAVAFWLTVDEIPLLTPYPAPPVTIGPLGPSRPPDGRLYDMAPFIHCDPALAGRGGPGQQENIQVERPDGLVLYGKFGQAGSYEMYATDANWMYSLEDASGPTESQAWTDPRWFPMHQAIGEQHAFVTGPHEAIYRDRHTCQELRRVPFNRKMWLHALWDAYQWGPDLGIRATAMRVYDNTDGFYSEKRIIEVRFEAWHAGWTRWEAHRSDLVYAHGAAEFADATLAVDEHGNKQRVDFYRLGGGNVQPVLDGCVPPIVPHWPPLQPIPPPEEVFMAATQVQGVIHYASKHASARVGCTNYILKNGNVFSCQQNGDAGERPPGTDADFEQGQEAGALTTFNSFGNLWTWLIAPIDKLP